MAIWRVLTTADVYLDDVAVVLVRQHVSTRRITWVISAPEETAATLKKRDGVVGIARASDEDILRPFAGS